MTSSPTCVSSSTSPWPGRSWHEDRPTSSNGRRGLLDRLLAAADDGQRSGSAIEILVVLALAHLAAGRTAEATAAVQDALVRAEDGGYVRTFLRCRAVDDRAAPLDSTERPAGGPPACSPPHADEPRPRSRTTADPSGLSDRELDVLRLLRSDLSGPDIARELHVSLNTLRTHTKHIYTKLGATNRREAVSRRRRARPLTRRGRAHDARAGRPGRRPLRRTDRRQLVSRR